jgi:ABC-2 type transport system permease protein
VVEIVRRGMAAVRRSGFWWGFGIVVFALLNMAFWPSFEDSNSLVEMEREMGDLLEAFGGQGMSQPPGYLDGQLFAFLLPLLLSGAAIAMVSSLTAGDEDAGRLELLHALPIRRATLWLARLGAGLAVLALIVAVTAALVLGALAPFSLEEAGYGAVLVATLACGVLAVFHAAVAYAVGGLGGSRGLALGVSIGVLVLGYLFAFVFPISDALEPFRWLSPWDWATGQQPVSDGTEPLRLAVVVLVTGVLVAVGTLAVERRDIKNP